MADKPRPGSAGHQIKKIVESGKKLTPKKAVITVTVRPPFTGSLA